MQRQISCNEYNKLEKEPNREYHALNSIYASSTLEEIMIVQRRMMLGGMRHPSATVLTIIFTGVEETLVRCTMMYRDEFWDRIAGGTKSVDSSIEAKRLVQAASIATSMRIEVTSIITCRRVLERRMLIVIAS